MNYNMAKYSGKTCRLLTMLSMTASFFLVEIIVGYITNSIALVADSFHMLSDVVALIVGFASVRISKWQTEKKYIWLDPGGGTRSFGECRLSSGALLLYPGGSSEAIGGI